MADKHKVLFLCTHNSCRSQMGEGLLRAMGGDRFAVYSAGLEPTSIHPLAAQVMVEAGVDISGQESTDIKEYLGRLAIEYVIVVCDKAEKACPFTFPGVNKRLYWPFEDPAACRGTDEQILAKFREVRDQIRARIADWLDTLPLEGE